MIRAKILAVDQDQGAYEPLKPGLSQHGYEIHTTATPAQALALAGAHAYQAAFISLALLNDQSLVTGLQAAIPELPFILTLSPEHTQSVSPQVLKNTVNAIGKPLALDWVCLVLDRTMELVTLRTRVRQQRQAWDVSRLLQITPAPPEGHAPPPGALSEVLAQKLLQIVPNLEIVGRGSLHRAVLSYVEKLLLTIVLAECRGNQVKSAELLGINRTTLRKKIHDLKLSIPCDTT